MRTPDSLIGLVDHGIIESVQRPLMSGKEAHIYLVESGGEPRVAKIYKDAQNRSFQNRADYTEGRKVRNSRDQRAMGSRSKHGRAQNEAAWKSAEVDMIYRLRAAGVRVPTPFNFIDGVLIMELVTDAEGYPAPRLGDLTFEPEQATEVFHKLLAEVVRMLCAGVVHGDLSEFNVLIDANGPVIIDFPQAVDASSNANARKLLLRDVDNLQRFHAKFVPGAQARPYAQEMWDLYSRNALTPDTRLTGKFRTREKVIDTSAVLDLIGEAERDERRRREALGLSMRGAGRTPSGAAGVEARNAPRSEQGARNQRPVQQARTTHRVEPAERPVVRHAWQRDDRPAFQARRSPSSEPAQRAERPSFDARRRPQQEQAQRAERRSSDTRQAPRNEQAPRAERPSYDTRQASRAEQPSYDTRQRPQQAQAQHTERRSSDARQRPQQEQEQRSERRSSDTRQSPRHEQAPRAERSTFWERPAQGAAQSAREAEPAPARRRADHRRRPRG